MERHVSDAVWIERDPEYHPESLTLGDSLAVTDVEASISLCSDMGRPVLLERICIDLVGNAGYEAEVELAYGTDLPARQALAPCSVLQLGYVSGRCFIRHKPAGESVESSMPFDLCIWAQWRSEGVAYTSRPVTLHSFEPAGFSRADDAFSLIPVE